MIKLNRVTEKTLNNSLKELHRLVNKFNEDFQRYRMGKVTFKRQVKVGDI